MEKFKNNIILENSVMQDKIDEWRNLLFLIVNMDYSISERTQTLTRIIYNWPKKLDQILDESNSVHFEQKEAIENKMQATKVKFEKEMEEFEEEIKEIETYVDLFSYPMYMIPINKFNQKFQGMKKRKERLELEETILIDETSPYESFVRVKKTFEPHYNFWKTTENFLDSKKKWKAVTASELNIEQIHNVKTDTKTMMKAVKGKLHEDQIKLIEGMLRQIKDLES
jgi:SHS2 domain-containing protein